MKFFTFRIFLLLAASVLICGYMSAAAASASKFTVVIDPGHGAHDAGALGVKTNEKSINLAVAKKLAKLISDGMKDAEVVMTRDNDTFVTLQGRADLANSKKADVFISIHANSIDKKAKNRTTIHGAAVYTLGLDRSPVNLSVAMRENEVMKLEKDYSTTYAGFDPSSTESYIMFDLVQHANLNSSISLAHEVQKELVSTAGRKNNGVKQAPFWVLVRTSMPAILVELDFICNPEMEKFMASESGQKKLARAIYNGLRNYRALSAGKIPSPATPEEEEQPEKDVKVKKAVKSDPTGEPVYKIQFLISSKKLPAASKEFKGVKNPDFYIDGGAYKYTYGNYKSVSDAASDLKKIKKSHPQAFVIKTIDGQRVK